MKGFYDKMVKNYAQKWGKKFDAKVGVTKIKAESDGNTEVYDRLVEATEKYEKGQRARSVFSGLTRFEIKRYIPEAILGGMDNVWSMKITKKMRDSLMKKGVPLFGAAGTAATIGMQGEGEQQDAI